MGCQPGSARALSDVDGLSLLSHGRHDYFLELSFDARLSHFGGPSAPHTQRVPEALRFEAPAS